jgi:hypothetical protein
VRRALAPKKANVEKIPLVVYVMTIRTHDDPGSIKINIKTDA